MESQWRASCPLFGVEEGAQVVCAGKDDILRERKGRIEEYPRFDHIIAHPIAHFCARELLVAPGHAAIVFDADSEHVAGRTIIFNSDFGNTVTKLYRQG